MHYFTVGYTLNEQEKYQSVSIQALPNPSASIINIELDGFGKEITFKLYDAFGKLILSKQLYSTDYIIRTSVDLTEYEKGIYFIKVDDGDKVRMKKVIKN